MFCLVLLGLIPQLAGTAGGTDPAISERRCVALTGARVFDVRLALAAGPNSPAVPAAPTWQEPEWRRERRRRAWVQTGVVTAIGVGLAVGGLATRNDDTGRGFAIAAGALGVGALFASPILSENHGPMAGFAVPFAGFLAVVGGLVGGGFAALTSGNPGGSRAAISITGGLLFTGALLVPIWSF